MAELPAHDDIAIQRRGEIVPRDEYLDYMTFRRPGRPLFTEIFGPLVGLKREWAQQGASPEELDFTAFRYRFSQHSRVPVATGFFPPIERRTLEETDEHVISTDARGRKVKLVRSAASIPLPLEYPVRNRDDWARIKPRYEFCEERFAREWVETARRRRGKDTVLSMSIPGGFDEPRQLMGEAELCIACYEQPDLVHDMLSTMGETCRRIVERVCNEVQVDQLDVHEDMAGKSGPLFGPRQIEQFIKPYYRGVWDLLQAAGARLFRQDSDGDMQPVIPAMMDAGVNFMFPFEPAAGMDPVAARKEYGKQLAIKGGIDKHVLRRGHEAIEAELETKLPPLIASGGVTLALDHRIPNGTPLEAYRFYILTAWRIIDRECERLGLK
jgi:hypothetical protein